MSEEKEISSIKNKNDNDQLFGIKFLQLFARLGGSRRNKKLSIFYTPFQIYILVLSSLQSLFQLKYCIDKLDEIEEFIIGFTLFLTWVKGEMKFLILNWHQQRIDAMYNSFEVFYQKFGRHCNKEKSQLFRDINKYMRLFSYFYTAVLYITALSWLCQMFVRTASEDSHRRSKIEIPDFAWTFHVDLYFPFVITNKIEFFICTLSQWYYYFWICITFAAVDLTYLLVMKYLQGHLKILNLEIRRSKECSKHEMKYILRNSIQYQNELYRVTKEIERVLGIDILYLCFAFTLLVSFTGYLMTQLELFSPAIMKLYTYVLWCNIQLYMLIKVANDIHVEMIKISEAAFDSKWEEADKTSKLFIELIIMRAQRSPPLSGTTFIEMTNETFSRLMNCAFSYIAVLRNFAEEE